MTAPATLDDMPPDAALTLLILYHNREEMLVSRLSELFADAITEHGSVEAAIKALRPNKRKPT